MAANLAQTHSFKSVIGTWDREVKVGLFCWLFVIEGKGVDIPNTKAQAQAPQSHFLLKRLGNDLLQN